MNKATFNKHLEIYKDLHKDKTAILFTTGPTLKEYIPIAGEGIIRIGVNKIYKHPNITETLNYYFFGSSYENNVEHRVEVNQIDNKIKKFASVYRDGAETGLGNITLQNAEKINATPFECGLIDFATDISDVKILGHSIVFPSLQFLLYTGVNKIYVVGCDVNNYYEQENVTHLKEWWQKFKNWVYEVYPHIEIIIINPVGLKGMFIDLNQNIS